MVTKVLNITANLSTDTLFCEECPALDNSLSKCCHLNVTLDFDKISDSGVNTFKFYRANFCPFNIPKCMICQKPLLPVEVKTKQWDLVHYCGNNKPNLPEIRITGVSYDSVITQYNEYLISIKKIFTQR